MEAICKSDFDKRVLARKLAEEAREKAKKDQKDNKDKKSMSEVSVPEVGFHEIYGVWFYGKLIDTILRISSDRFGIELNKQLCVFVDEDPKKIVDGVHDISVYEYPCKLYKWTAQGYYRGLVVLEDDEAANGNAEVYRQSGTWSWMLDCDDKARLS